MNSNEQPDDPGDKQPPEVEVHPREVKRGLSCQTKKKREKKGNNGENERHSSQQHTQRERYIDMLSF